MRLEPEQLKKGGIVLGSLIVLLYVYFAFLLGPLQETGLKDSTGIETLGPQITDATVQMGKTADLEKHAPEATAYLTALRNSIPDGAPIAWFPPKMTQFFKRHGIEKSSTHMATEAPDSTPGFCRIVWSIDVPKVDFNTLGLAICALENEEPLMTVISIAIDATREDAQNQHVTLTVSTLVKS
jgi:hypothetical protein